MPDSEIFADIILPFPLQQVFTYSVPNEYAEIAASGMRVVVQFGAKRLYTGIVQKIHITKPINYAVKPIVSILDKQAVINTIQLEHWTWLSNYYMSPIGDVMKAALPAGFKLESDTHVYFNEQFENTLDISADESLILTLIEKEHQMSIADITSKAGKRNVIQAIKSLYEKGAVIIDEQLREGYKPQNESFVRLSSTLICETNVNEAFDSLKKAKKQLEVLTHYLRLSEWTENIEPIEVKKSELLKQANASYATFNTLLEKGIFETYTKEKSRIEKNSYNTSELNKLNSFQDKAFQEIISSFEEKDVTLLHGITSSGKTEIYIHLIAQTIAQGKQALYLLPEIALTTQIINRLRQVFGNKVGVYHSKFNDSERVEIWNKLLINNDDSYQIILGVRSSVFLPFSKLGLIIIDEEHENTYKQFDPSPRYHARDAAIVLAGMHKSKVLLGTATPSLESYFNAMCGKYGLVKLDKRYKEIKLPEIRLVNTLIARKKGNMNSHFSKELINALEETLKKDKQAILFQNRRGYSPFNYCEDCGNIPHCKYCDVSLTLHRSSKQLTCHYCGYAVSSIHKCVECGSTNLKTKGFGTEKIEDEISVYFPSARIERMDVDSTRKKHAHEEIIARFEAGAIDILIGTQMVSKGLDFANVHLIGILDADSMLNYPDFRAYERSFQLMSQVAGRAGRSNERGLVYIQTAKPGHPIISQVVKNNYLEMLNEQLAERRDFHYPPFYRLMRITLKHRDENTCNNGAQQLANTLKKRLGNRIVGPDFPLINRIQSLFLKNILIKMERDKPASTIKELVAHEIKALSEVAAFKSILINIDVDPM